MSIFLLSPCSTFISHWLSDIPVLCTVLTRFDRRVDQRYGDATIEIVAVLRGAIWRNNRNYHSEKLNFNAQLEWRMNRTSTVCCLTYSTAMVYTACVRVRVCVCVCVCVCVLVRSQRVKYTSSKHLAHKPSANSRYRPSLPITNYDVIRVEVDIELPRFVSILHEWRSYKLDFLVSSKNLFVYSMLSLSWSTHSDG